MHTPIWTLKLVRVTLTTKQTEFILYIKKITTKICLSVQLKEIALLAGEHFQVVNGGRARFLHMTGFAVISGYETC